MSQIPREPREVIREEPLMHQPILQALRDGPLTIPQIAERLAAPPREVLIWVMGMRRYGHLVELPDADDDGYYQYATVARDGARQ